MPATDSVAYYERVREHARNTDDFYRLYLVSGMNHCFAGDGVYMIEFQGAIEKWAENGAAAVGLTGMNPGGEGSASYAQPVCSYPMRARYDGAGNPDKAESFTCESADHPEIPRIDARYLR